MARFDPQQRGSKRRVAQIRWKRREVIHAFILIALMTAFCLCIGIWVATHHFD
jgi:preprotein translocase subunit SecE